MQNNPGYENYEDNVTRAYETREVVIDYEKKK